MRAKTKTCRVNLDFDPEQHATVKRRASSAGLSMHAYIVHMSVDGKLPKRHK